MVLVVVTVVTIIIINHRMKVVVSRVLSVLVVVVVLFSTFRQLSNKVYIRKVDIRFDKNCDYRVLKMTTSTTKDKHSLKIKGLRLL